MPIHSVSRMSGANTAISRGDRSRMPRRSSRVITPKITRRYKYSMYAAPRIMPKLPR